LVLVEHLSFSSAQVMHVAIVPCGIVEGFKFNITRPRKKKEGDDVVITYHVGSIVGLPT
jgi:hypothetical protein